MSRRIFLFPDAQQAATGTYIPRGSHHSALYRQLGYKAVAGTDERDIILNGNYQVTRKYGRAWWPGGSKLYRYPPPSDSRVWSSAQTHLFLVDLVETYDILFGLCGDPGYPSQAWSVSTDDAGNTLQFRGYGQNAARSMTSTGSGLSAGPCVVAVSYDGGTSASSITFMNRGEFANATAGIAEPIMGSYPPGAPEIRYLSTGYSWYKGLFNGALYAHLWWPFALTRDQLRSLSTPEAVVSFLNPRRSTLYFPAQTQQAPTIIAPKRAVQTRQPQVAPSVDPKFKASAVYLPKFGGRNLARPGYTELTESYVTRSGTGGGVEWKHTAADFNLGLTYTPAAASFESWLFVMGSNVSGNLAPLGWTGTGVVGANGILSLYMSSAQMTTLSTAVGTGDAVFASFTNVAPVLATRYEYLTAANGFGNLSVGGMMLRDNDRLLFLVRWDDYVPDEGTIRSLVRNPWQIFEPQRSIVVVPGATVSGVTYLRPVADASNSGWVGDPDNTNRYANVDEATANDTDLVYTVAAGSVLKLTLTTGDVAAGDIIRYRAKSTYSNSLKVSVYNASNSLVEEWTESLTSTIQQFQHTLTAGGTGPCVIWLTAL